MFRILIDAREISEETNFETRALMSILPKFLQPQVKNAPRDRTDLPHLPPCQAQADNLHTRYGGACYGCDDDGGDDDGGSEYELLAAG